MSRMSLALASSLMVALPLRNWSCKLAISACFLSRSAFFGANRPCNSPAAFCPSLVCRMAFCTWMIATLVGVWAWTIAAIPRTKAGTTKFFFKLKTPKCENTTILDRAALGLERSTNCKTEHRAFLEVRVPLTELRHRIKKCILVREGGAVGHDGRLEILSDDGRVVSPIQAEGR